jgi:hypothetical protein
MGAAAGTTAPRLLPSVGPEAGPPAAPATDSQPAPGPAEEAADLRPVLHLIGESLGLGPDPQRAEAARSVSLLRRYLANAGTEKTEAAAANGTTAALDDLRGGLYEPDPSEPGYAAAQRQAAEVLSQPIEGVKDGSEVAAARKQLLAFLRGEVSDESLLRRLQEKALDACISVDFLIAGIPDYVDSNVGWYADLDLEAIQAAMVTAGYTFDRFYLPDWPRTGHEAHTHRESPGAVLFRARLDGGLGKLRVVLLVPETPTAGFNREALRSALTLVRTWDTTSEIRILGPQFSGSIDSLARVLREDTVIWNHRRVRIISGTAATPNNRTVLEADAKAFKDSKGDNRKMVEFSTTTHPFPEWLGALQRFLASIDLAWAEGDRVAVLHESNTAFGSVSAVSAGGTSNKEGIFRHLTRIAFPLHISRLREAAAVAATAAVHPGQTRALIPLTDRGASTPIDQLPLLAPDLTGAAVEATIAAVFDALHREQFRVVAIIATDERDTLYLAREVRRISPDTQIVLFGGQMLAFHPDYASYMRGAIVVSSYPLAAAAAHWGVSATSRTRRHFPTWFAEGIYNAVLALVGNHDLVDYAVQTSDRKRKDEADKGPPVWINVIGRTGFVPLVAYPPGGNSFLHLESVAAVPDPKPAPPSLPVVLMIGTFMLVFGWHVWAIAGQVAFIFRHRKMARTAFDVTWRKTWSGVRRRPMPALEQAEIDAQYNAFEADRHTWVTALQEQRVTGFHRVFVLPWRPVHARRTANLFVHAAFGVFGLVLAWWVLLFLRSRAWTGHTWPVAAGATAAAVPLLLALTQHSSRIKDREQPEGQSAHTGTPGQGRAFAWMVSLGILVGVPVLIFVLGPPPEGAGGVALPIQTAYMEADRGFGIVTLVSPTVPVVCFALCIYTWLVWQLRGLSFVGNGYTKLLATREAVAQTVAIAVGQSAGASAGASPHQPLARLQTPPVGRVEPSMTSVLLSGDLGVPGEAVSRWQRAFTRTFDFTLPTRHTWKPLAATLLLVGVAAVIVCIRVYTLEGPRFTAVFRAATLGGLGLATLTLLQTCAQWRQVGGILARLGRSRLAPAFVKVREFQLDWRLNFRLPRRDELSLLMAETDALEASFRNAAQRPADVPLTSERAFRERDGRQLLISTGLIPDLTSLAAALEKEQRSDCLRLLNTDAFCDVWARTRRYLPLIERWLEIKGHAPDAPPNPPNGEHHVGPTGFEWRATAWLERAQGAVALAQAFVLRDLLSRILAGLSAACLCFVLLLAAHVLYSFPGRSTMLTIDWIAVGASGAIAVWILVGMERSVVLSHLWDSVPGRVSFNRDFVQRLALYGALPVLTLISALFPEMGDTIFSWLAPARQLAGF